MAATWAQWLLVNIAKACRWRGNTTTTTDGCGNKFGPSQCAHDCEGGVDVPLSPGTPIYALATGPLVGKGTFFMGGGGFGHSVVTQDVSGVGKVYYQHLDALASIPDCVNGGCNGYVVQQGQLIGYSNADIGEVEIGINPAWGGIWGPPNNGQGWALDPRQELISLANGNINPNSSGCVQCGFLKLECCAPMVCQSGNCVLPPVATATQAVSSILPGWLQNPDWMRVLKMVAGIIMLGVALLGLFWPQAEQVIGTVAKSAELAA